LKTSCGFQPRTFEQGLATKKENPAITSSPNPNQHESEDFIPLDTHCEKRYEAFQQIGIHYRNEKNRSGKNLEHIG